MFKHHAGPAAFYLSLRSVEAAEGTSTGTKIGPGFWMSLEVFLYRASLS
jgi:hypothetical protein